MLSEPCGKESEKSAPGRMERVIAAVFVTVPEVPETVTVAVPAAAVAAAVNVRVLPEVEEEDANAAVTPVGSPDTAIETLPVKPFWAVTAMLEVPVLPAMMLRLAGDAATANEGVPVTVRAISTVLMSEPAVPVTVTVAGPETAAAVAEKVTVLVPVALTGLTWAVTPAGRPDTVKATGELKPF
jgi:hypothetical protein